MIRRLLADLYVFLFLLALAMLSYGIAIEAVLAPLQPFGSNVVIRAVAR